MLRTRTGPSLEERKHWEVPKQATGLLLTALKSQLKVCVAELMSKGVLIAIAKEERGKGKTTS